MIAGVEHAQYIQETFHDIDEACMNPRRMLCTRSEEFLPLDVATDCRDLEEGLMAPVQHTSDQTMAIYIAALRADIYSGRVRKVFWVDTRDMLSNGATKLNLKSEKHLDLDLYVNVFKKCAFRPRHAYRCNSKEVPAG